MTFQSIFSVILCGLPIRRHERMSRKENLFFDISRFLCICRLQSVCFPLCCVKGLFAKEQCCSAMGKMSCFDQQLLCLLNTLALI